MRHAFAPGLGILFLVALDLVAPVAGLAAEKYALLVGVRTYQRTELRSLNFTENDVTGLADVLRNAGYDADNVVLMTQTTGADRVEHLPLADNIRNQLQLVLKELQPEDSILVAFSGHGVQFPGDAAAYFCPTDARLADRETLISLSDVYQALDACPAQSRLLLVDACRDDPQSGVNKNAGDVELEPVGRRKPATPPGGVVALFSCSAGERSFELPELNHGIFFHFVIEGLSGNADARVEDEAPDGQITLSELESFVVRRVQRTARKELSASQTPERLGTTRGELALASVARRPAPRPDLKPLDVIENTIGMKLVLVPAGEFEMGSPAGEIFRIDNETQHHVRLTRDFFLGQTEVTVGQFRRFANDADYTTEAEGVGKGSGVTFNATNGAFERDPTYNWRKPGFSQTDAHPVVCLTWNDAQAFVKWLSEKEHATYRLPTEAEWEYACRAGTKTAYHCGNDPEAVPRVGNVTDGTAWMKFPNLVAISAQDGHIFTAPVGTFQSNAFNLFDMHGNAWEWCADYYGEYPAGGAVDPVGPASGSVHIIRGGGWIGYPSDARCAYRSLNVSVSIVSGNGFRVVRER